MSDLPLLIPREASSYPTQPSHPQASNTNSSSSTSTSNASSAGMRWADRMAAERGARNVNNNNTTIPATPVAPTSHVGASTSAISGGSLPARVGPLGSTSGERVVSRGYERERERESDRERERHRERVVERDRDRDRDRDRVVSGSGTSGALSSGGYRGSVGERGYRGGRGRVPNPRHPPLNIRPRSPASIPNPIPALNANNTSNGTPRPPPHSSLPTGPRSISGSGSASVSQSIGIRRSLSPIGRSQRRVSGSGSGHGSVSGSGYERRNSLGDGRRSEGGDGGRGESRRRESSRYDPRERDREVEREGRGTNVDEQRERDSDRPRSRSFRSLRHGESRPRENSRERERDSQRERERFSDRSSNMIRTRNPSATDSRSRSTSGRNRRSQQERQVDVDHDYGSSTPRHQVQQQRPPSRARNDRQREFQSRSEPEREREREEGEYEDGEVPTPQTARRGERRWSGTSGEEDEDGEQGGQEMVDASARERGDIESREDRSGLGSQSGIAGSTNPVGEPLGGEEVRIEEEDQFKRDNSNQAERDRPSNVNDYEEPDRELEMNTPEETEQPTEEAQRTTEQSPSSSPDPLALGGESLQEVAVSPVMGMDEVKEDDGDDGANVELEEPSQAGNQEDALLKEQEMQLDELAIEGSEKVEEDTAESGTAERGEEAPEVETTVPPVKEDLPEQEDSFMEPVESPPSPEHGKDLTTQEDDPMHLGEDKMATEEVGPSIDLSDKASLAEAVLTDMAEAQAEDKMDVDEDVIEKEQDSGRSSPKQPVVSVEAPSVASGELQQRIGSPDTFSGRSLSSKLDDAIDTIQASTEKLQAVTSEEDSKAREPEEYLYDVGDSELEDYRDIVAAGLRDEKDVSEGHVKRLRRQWHHLDRTWQEQRKLLEEDNEAVMKQIKMEEQAAAPPVEVKPTGRRARARGVAELQDLMGIRDGDDAGLERVLQALAQADEADPTQRALRTEAVVPDMILSCDPEARLFFDDDSDLVSDPLKFYDIAREQGLPWTDEEDEQFWALFPRHPKQFGIISQRLRTRTPGECVEHYYLTKKTRGVEQAPPRTTRSGAARMSGMGVVRNQAEKGGSVKSIPATASLLPSAPPDMQNAITESLSAAMPSTAPKAKTKRKSEAADKAGPQAQVETQASGPDSAAPVRVRKKPGPKKKSSTAEPSADAESETAPRPVKRRRTKAAPAPAPDEATGLGNPAPPAMTIAAPEPVQRLSELNAGPLRGFFPAETATPHWLVGGQASDLAPPRPPLVQGQIAQRQSLPALPAPARRAGGMNIMSLLNDDPEPTPRPSSTPATFVPPRALDAVSVASDATEDDVIPAATRHVRQHSGSSVPIQPSQGYRDYHQPQPREYDQSRQAYYSSNGMDQASTPMEYRPASLDYRPTPPQPWFFPGQDRQSNFRSFSASAQDERSMMANQNYGQAQQWHGPQRSFSGMVPPQHSMEPGSRSEREAYNRPIEQVWQTEQAPPPRHSFSHPG